MKKTACLVAMMASLAAVAGSAGAEGTDFVVTAFTGEVVVATGTLALTDHGHARYCGELCMKEDSENAL